jgi:hypothetical protein
MGSGIDVLSVSDSMLEDVTNFRSDIRVVSIQHNDANVQMTVGHAN